MQRWFSRKTQRNQPHATDIARWQQNFKETGNIGHRETNSRPRVPSEKFEETRLSFQGNPRISIRSASATLNISRSTVDRILRGCILLHPNKIQNSHFICHSDRKYRLYFAYYSQKHPEGNLNFLLKTLFTDECFSSQWPCQHPKCSNFREK